MDDDIMDRPVDSDRWVDDDIIDQRMDSDIMDRRVDRKD